MPVEQPCIKNASRTHKHCIILLKRIVQDQPFTLTHLALPGLKENEQLRIKAR